jgi:hypothetical protein
MSKIAQIVLVIITIISTGCVRVTPVSLGDGTNAYELSCPGSARSYADCRNKAAEICGGKYKEVDAEEYSSGAFVDSNSGMIFQGRQRRMTVICK